MSIQSSTISLALPGLLTAVLFGCAEKPAEAQRIDAEAWKSPHLGVVSKPTTIAVAQGSTPLVYSMRQTGIVRVIDDKTGTQVAHIEVRSGQIVAVEERGVVVAGKALTPALPVDRSYTIYVDLPDIGATQPGRQP